MSETATLERTATATREAPLVEMRDIVKHFGHVIALGGVSLKVHAGEVLCLLGDNGAGKSTLIKTLSGVHKPTSGEMLVEGRPIVFGHLGEGNLHVNVLGAESVAEEVTDAVLRLVAAHQGSISSEHGIGRAKVGWLGLSRSPAEIAAMRRIKDSLDPAGLLNPGVLLPDPMITLPPAP